MTCWKNIRGLIVDDEPEILEIFKELFEIRGSPVDCALNGQEAIKKARENHFDFIISDVRMPGGDGIHLLRQIQAELAYRPVTLLISSYADFSPQDAKNLGAVALLAKPFDQVEIEGLLEEYLSSN